MRKIVNSTREKNYEVSNVSESNIYIYVKLTKGNKDNSKDTSHMIGRVSKT